MTTPSQEHDDDLESTVSEDEIEIDRYDVDEASEADAEKPWTPAGPEPSAPHEVHHEDEPDDTL